jgi:hypothetical protein
VSVLRTLKYSLNVGNPITEQSLTVTVEVPFAAGGLLLEDGYDALAADFLSRMEQISGVTTSSATRTAEYVTEDFIL